MVDLLGGSLIRFCFFEPFENSHLVCDEMGDEYVCFVLFFFFGEYRICMFETTEKVEKELHN